MTSLPLVSCVMPTGNRAGFIEQAMRQFTEQRYPNKELVVVYDHPDDLPKDLVLPPGVRLIHSINRSIGSKRNEGSYYAQGAYIAQWDDDDIYHPDRLERQLAPLLANEADITGLQDILFYEQETDRYWSCSSKLFADLFVEQVAGGTLVYRKSLWENVRYRSISLREDAEFLQQAILAGARLARIPGRDLYIYRRHQQNTWRFPVGSYHNPLGWKQEPSPEWVSVHHTPDILTTMSLKTENPMVSCIMPTYDRSNLVVRAIHLFLAQDYSNKELIIVDDGRESVAQLVPDHPGIRYLRLNTRNTVGAKRNIACELSLGEIILHWDDDDWYAPDWISQQVLCMQQTGADICGLDRVFFYAPLNRQAWRYEYDGRAPWVAGGTLAYRRDFWRVNPFADVQVGEDNAFVWSAHQEKVVAHTYQEGFVGFVHAGNTSPKETAGRRWKPYPVETVEKIMGVRLL